MVQTFKIVLRKNYALWGKKKNPYKIDNRQNEFTLLYVVIDQRRESLFILDFKNLSWTTILSYGNGIIAIDNKTSQGIRMTPIIMTMLAPFLWTKL